MSAKVLPITDGSLAPGSRGSPRKPLDSTRTSARLHQTSTAGASLLEQKIMKERTRKELTKREEDGAVGSWLFGRGGIRGFSLNKSDLQERASADDAAAGDGAMVTSGALVTAAIQTGPKKAHAGQSRMEVLMEQYKKQTADHHKRQQAANSGNKGPDATTRTAESRSMKAKTIRAIRNVGKRVRYFLDCVCNGSSDSEQQRLDNAPVVLGSYHRKVVERLGVTQDQLKKLRSIFRRIDYSDFGNVALEELVEYVDETPNPILDRLYVQLIESQTGDGRDAKLLTFENFVMFVLVFGSMSERDILKFVFDSFDVDSSGHLEPVEIAALLAAINHNRPMYPGNHAKMLMEFDVDQDGRISFKEFKTLHKTYPAALFPVFRMYDKIQAKTLGIPAFVAMATQTAHLRTRTEAQKEFTRQRLIDEGKLDSDEEEDTKPENSRDSPSARLIASPSSIAVTPGSARKGSVGLSPSPAGSTFSGSHRPQLSPLSNKPSTPANAGKSSSPAFSSPIAGRSRSKSGLP